MKKKKLIKNYKKIEDIEQQKLFHEYAIFCNYAETEVFENFLKIDEIGDFDFYCLIESFFKLDCYNMLYRVLKQNHERIINSQELAPEDLEDIKLRSDFKDRFNKFMFSK